MSLIDRYRPLVDDFDAFLAASGAPLPRVVWTHPGRATPERLRAWLERDGLTAHPLGLPGVFRITGTTHPGKLLAYRLGLCHVQEEVSLVPPELLGARPGERVLDACAAPGGKTARIALGMEGRGTVVANDRSSGRLRALSSQVERLGLVNVVATRANAASLPRGFGSFDRILCDVPCSGEGTSRKNPRVLTDPVPDRAALARLQESILYRATRALRPGGRIVYSTCTYAPEENEAVVDAVLARTDGEVRIIPATIDGLASRPGVTEWEGRRFDESLSGTLRFWPHVSDSGGFFVAVLEKRDDAVAPFEPGEPVGAEDGEPARALVRRFAERFGIDDSAFERLTFRWAAKKRVTMESVDLAPPPIDAVVHRGVPFCHPRSVDVMPTTTAAREFATRATCHVVTLDRAQADTYCGRGDQRLSATEVDGDVRGFVFVVHDGVALGSGVVRRGADGPTLESFFPKALAELAE